MIIFVRHGVTQANLDKKYIGWTDQPMHEEGFLQIEKISERLKNFKFKRVYSSPLNRCLQTAHLILQNTSQQANGQQYERQNGQVNGQVTEQAHGLFQNAINSNKLDFVENNYPFLHETEQNKNKHTMQFEKKDREIMIEPALKECYFGDWEMKQFNDLSLQDQEIALNCLNDPFQFAPPNGENFYQFDHRLFQWFKRFSEINCSGEALLVVTHGGPLRWLNAAILEKDIYRYWQVEGIAHGDGFILESYNNNWRRSPI
jgi:broad specificity phosphatase PhoE